MVRDDVWINFLGRRGKLTVGFGSPGRIGPELEFGNAVGDHLEEWKKIGSDRPYHYLGSAKFFSRVGKAFGKAIIELCDKRK